MNKKLLTTAIIAAIALGVTSCKKEAAHHDHDGHDHGTKSHSGHDHGDEAHGHEHATSVNGGELVMIGNKNAVLEIVADENTGTYKLFVFEADAKTPLAITQAPSLVVPVNGKRAMLETKAEKTPSSSFEITSEHLKGHIHGGVIIKLDSIELPFSVGLPDHH
jgi:ABC-type Zn2+ transport system substrate-binding protein/surface adhesin